MGEHFEQRAGQRGDAPSVIVVGAGVSGCACAVALAEAGLFVTLLNSAMDRVGLPAYGPDLVPEDGKWERLEQAMNAIPLPLRGVWLGAAERPADGEPVMNVDRRRISIETKRALERVPGLRFRQGFVVDLRVISFEEAPSPQRVQVETVFGEIFEADAVVLAVGLSLGGRSIVGADSVAGGRYGEPASDGLVAALERLGAQFEDAILEVGSRAPARDFFPEACATGDSGTARGTCVKRRLVNVGGEGHGGQWPADFPPAPHLDPDLRLQSMVMSWGDSEERDGRSAWLPVVSPDGAATAEVYLVPGYRAVERDGVAPRISVDCPAEDGDLVVTRMPVRITAKRVACSSETGRVTFASRPAPLWAPVWVVGRSAGAKDYAASLTSGVRVAADIVAVLNGGREHG